MAGGETLQIALAVIGAGWLGRRLAARAARAGCRVTLEDVMPANLRRAEEELRSELGEAFAVPWESGSPVARFALTVEDAARDADLVIDCVPDELESKLEIFSLLDRMAPPRTILMTPTTRLSIADLASCTYRPERCVGIGAEARALAANFEADARPMLTLRTTPRTLPEVVVLTGRFWTALGYLPTFELDAGESGEASRQ